MPAYRITNFKASIPKLESRNIADGFATSASNGFFTSGRIDPMLEAVKVGDTKSPFTQTIYRMFHKGVSYWLNWDEQVDVAESPVFVENGFRVMFTSPSFEPRQTDLSLAATGAASMYPGDFYVLGVTPPVTAPSVAVVGGSGTQVTRTYVYTYATQWGEESAPSPAAATLAGFINGAWNITLPDVAPPNTYTISAATYVAGRIRLTAASVFGLRAKETITLSGFTPSILNNTWRIDEVDTASKYVYITMADPGAVTLSTATAVRVAKHNTAAMVKRVYRSVTSSAGTEYFYVGEVPAATTAFTDSATVLGETLATLGFGMPPADMEGIVVHPSGSTVGFSGNQIYISEPYIPYAYPIAYELTLDYSIVSIGVFGQSIVVGTTGKPYVITFTDPANATAQKTEENWPCVAKRGMISFSGGVYFPTTLGLAYIGGSGVRLVSSEYYAQQDWAKINASSFVAGSYNGDYYAIRTVDGVQSALIFTQDQGVVELSAAYTAFYTDRETGALFAATNGDIMQLNAKEAAYIPYSWLSKEYVIPVPVNLGAAKIDFYGELDQNQIDAANAANVAIIASNEAIIAGGPIDTLNIGVSNSVVVNYTGLADLAQTSGAMYVAFTLLVNGKVVFSKHVKDSKVFRLPHGLKYDAVQIRLDGTAPIKALLLGDTPAALRAV